MTTATRIQTCVHGHEMTPENVYTRPDGKHECRRCKRQRGADSDARAHGRGPAVKYALGYGKHEPMPEKHPEPQTGWKRLQLAPSEAKLRGTAAVLSTRRRFVSWIGHWPTVCLCTAVNVCEVEGLIVRVANPAMGEPPVTSDTEFQFR